MDLKETSTISLICDDALGGSTSIDSRKFADEFIKKRGNDLAGIPWKAPTETLKPLLDKVNKSDSEQGVWTPVGGGSARTVIPNNHTSSSSILKENKFALVGGKTKKKKGKK